MSSEQTENGRPGMGSTLWALPWQPIEAAPKSEFHPGILAYGRHTMDNGPHWSIGDHWWSILRWDSWHGTPKWVFSKDGTDVWSEPTHWLELTLPGMGEQLLPFPAELTPELGEVLGLMLWNTCPIAHGFRDAGEAEIPRKSEAEQAFVLHWLVRVALEHGLEWRKAASTRISDLLARAKAARADESAVG